MLDADLKTRSSRQGFRADYFQHTTKLTMDTLENDRGGTAFYFTFCNDNAISNMAYVLILNTTKYIIDFRPTRNISQSLLFINLNNM
ncbi:20072_t:CDS:1, partial [Gigaspora rosea]